MKLLAAFFLSVMGCYSSYAQVPVIQYQTVVTGLADPLDIANAADGSNRLFIVQQGGQVRIWDGSFILPDPFINLSGVISSGGERGLLSIAFHPGYATNRYFFVYYTKAGDGSLTIARYRTLESNPNQADAASGVEILNILHPTNANHNGGKLQFGADGFLYVGTGDGGGSNDVPNNAQNGNSLLGKMLRIDVNDFTDATPPLYSIPAANPYTNDGNVLDEIIALGLRNPFRWSFDRTTHDMWIGDVGQGAREEVDFRAAGDINSPTNYGWRCMEGNITNPDPTAACPAPSNYVPPIFDYTHDAATGGNVLTGGYVYRGNDFTELKGYYICTDFGSGNIWLIKNNGTGFDATLQTVNMVTGIAAFGEAESGALYAVRLTDGVNANSGVLYKVVPASVLPIKLISFTAVSQGNLHVIKWRVQGLEKTDLQVLEKKLENENEFSEAGRVAVSSENESYTMQLAATNAETYYRLKIMAATGTVTYSPVAKIDRGSARNGFTASITGSQLTINLVESANRIEILSGGGSMLYTKTTTSQGVIQIPLSNIPHQILFIKLYSALGSRVQKIAW